jgi:hypothetical protein
MCMLTCIYGTVSHGDLSDSLAWNLHPWAATSLSDGLFSSFSQVGVLHPPYVLPCDNGCLQIISGFRRCHFSAAVANDAAISCLILPRDTGIATLLDLILEEQHTARPLSLVEKARFLEICRQQNLSSGEILERYAEKLALRRQRATLDQLTALLKEDALFVEGIDQGQVLEKMVGDLLLLTDASDRLALVRLFRKLRMGDNQQKKFYAALRDLVKRHQTPMASYLQSPGISAILDHPTMNLPQKVQNLGTYLQEQLSPEAVRAEQAFQERRRELRLPSCCSLQHSQSFESDAVDLTITFKNLSECAEVLPAIKSLFGENG